MNFSTRPAHVLLARCHYLMRGVNHVERTGYATMAASSKTAAR